MARKLSQITGNGDIIAMALLCAMARRVIFTEDEKKQYWEDLQNMKLDNVYFADMVTGGQFSFLQKEFETLSAENKSKDGTIEDMRRTIDVLAQRAVLALRADNKSVGEISEILEISSSEVTKILERVESDKKRFS
ncbi:MAG: hypothetical protein LBO66_08100 [Deltaproteobacteria bacterium]|jgi:DNA-directed RNA polymerase specialized sigma24 family protein|nr:hypothetical protein [Deltaproteobacteria bacterium]